MSAEVSSRITMILSIVERGKCKRLIDMMNQNEIPFHIQSVGHGTAPSEMMDILGLGTKDKDVVISFAPERAVASLIAGQNQNLGEISGYGGLMMVIRLSAISRLAAEVFSHPKVNNDEREEQKIVSGETKYNLILISVNQGYADAVMQTAKKAGATGGTVIRGRLAGAEMLEQLAVIDSHEEKEIISILAPAIRCDQIMSAVNKEFGLRSEAKGIVCAVPVEKALKI